MNVKELAIALSGIQENRMISYDVVVSALKEGLAKAYRKHIECPDAQVRVEVSDKGEISVFQQRRVIDGEVLDGDIELSLEEAREIKPDAQIDDILEEEVSIDEFGRSTVTLVRNVLLQKIKEASKQMVYDEFIDKVDDLVYGVVQTVEEKYTLIDLGKTLALMPKSEQIPGEKLKDGQRVRVVIKSVSKESKGAQVIVSRSSAMLVKRLFESTVTEIYDGTVEIKAIAREANERTKMAVYSKNPNVDPIGACIGPRGQRVIAVIEEITQQGNPLSHENIDIFEWNPNYIEYVKEVMKPANVLAVLPKDEKDLLIVVEDDQLSQAIGKKGINARLAVKILNCKIDIKTQSDVEAEGIDWYNEMMAFAAKTEALRKQKAIEEARKAEEEQARLAQEAEETTVVETPVVETPVEEEKKEEPVVVEVKPAEEPIKEEKKEEPVVEEVKPAEEPTEEEKVTKKRKPKLEIKASDYVSKYEELADAKKSTQEKTSSRKKKNTREDEEEAELRKKLEALKNREYEIKPEYSEEELEEFNSDDDDHWYDDDDVDYDDYNEFYDD